MVWEFQLDANKINDDSINEMLRREYVSYLDLFSDWSVVIGSRISVSDKNHHHL